MKKTFKFFQIVLLICGVCVAEADEVKTVMEGESVTLNTGLTETQEIIVTLWRFGESGSTIAQMDRKEISYPNPNSSHIDIFRGKLQMDQTGSLTINNMRTKHSGLYQLESDLKSGSSHTLTFNVTVSESPSVHVGEAEMKSMSVMEGNSVTLQTDVTETNGDELIVWRFGDEGKLIAKYDVVKSSPLLNTDERFRDRLQLDHQTGSLTIIHTRTTDSGEYTLKINSNKQTLYKRFIVTVSAVTDPGLSSGAVAGIVIVVLLLFAAAAAAGLIYHRRQISELERQKERISVEEGNNLIINPETEIQKDDLIQWRFGYQDILIAEISGGTLKTHDDAADGRFRGRLKLDEKTGSLIITDMRTKHTGDYKLQIISSRGNTNKRFVVYVSERKISVKEGKNLIINPETEIQKDDLIQWRFRDILIAEIRGGTLKTHDDADDGRFRGRLKLDEKTGSLIITDMITEHTGDYKLQIISSRGNTNKRFDVSASERKISVKEGKNLIINPETEIQKDDLIQWRFGYQDILIAEIRGGTLKTHDDVAGGRFRGRLKLDEKTGSLIITDMITEHTGKYKLQIISSRGNTNKRFVVFVSARRISVKEGKNLIINPETEIQKDDLIEWRFGDILIAEIRGGTLKTHDDADDGRFRGRLKLDEKTGSLTITDITTQHTGEYKLQIISSRGNTNKRFDVFVSEREISVEEGKNLIINPETEIQKDDLIQWRFRDILIAEIRGGTLKTHDDAAGGRFRGRLKLDEKTGSLVITDITTEHTGKYKLQIISSRGNTNKRFDVFVSARVISVKEGKNLIINPETEIQKDDLIQWRFGDILIAEIRGGTLKTHDDAAGGRFRDRLKLDEKTGSLTITDMITEHTGNYKLQIISSRGNTNKRFVVYVSARVISVKEGKNLIINPETEIQKDDLIEWRFGYQDILIAEIRGGTLKTHDDAADGRFRGRLKLDEKTGSLIITDMITELTGEYKLQIISSRGNTNKRFDVFVSARVISVEEGKNLIINPETEIQKDDLIQWRFGYQDILIAEIRGGTLKTHDDAADDGRFRDRLKLDEKTGSLIITDMRTEHTGDYKLQIISSREITSKRFVVYVSARRISVEEGKNLIINPETEIQKDDQIQWRFGYQDILIAEIRGGTLKTHDDAAGGRFRDRLKLDEKTGSLIITDITTKHTGDYKLQIISSREITSKRFVVSVFENISVEEGKNLIINPETEIQEDDLIQWRFGDILIAEIRGGTLKTHDDADDGRFRGRLKLDEKTGSLTITDITTEHTGNYKLQIISSRGNTNKRFVVYVSEKRISVEEGKNLIINPETEIQKDDLIQWRFGYGDILIAEISGGTLKTHDDADDGIFRGRLKLDEKTGSLIITDITTKHTGDYKLQIISSREITSKRFVVSVFGK
ncbi:uncharacterized protein LOC120474283 isoform X1 [Pimephales promelas]|uniref:uncharacterized protein LOC120474283 isoform X1 n=1 Tax=Pimephales promelas TaxID=90988 RepID=UPI0019557DBE|nr:uncharacterized protein LOC120474283 isoform X1 [Pimephales promelas]